MDEGITTNIIDRLNRMERRVEDLEDVQCCEDRKGEPTIPYEQVRRKLGLAPPPMPVSPVITADNPPQ